MSSATAPPPRRNRQVRPPARPNLPRKTVLIIIPVSILILAVVSLGSALWPFSQASIVQDLREASDSQLQVRSFQRTYFPFPGCLLEGVVFSHDPAEPTPLITVEKVTIRGTYLGLFTKRVSRITVEGLHVTIPAFGTSQPFHTTPSKITIDEIVLNGSVVDFDFHRADKPPLRFEVHEASLRNVGWKGPLTYRLKVHNPEPPGEIATEGQFGVWDKSDPGQTTISGDYTFDHADLAIYRGVSGIL